MERYLFSTIDFPVVPSSESLTLFATNPPPSADLPEQFRATLTRLSSLSSTLSPLPEDCSFTIIAELRDGAEVDPPLGNNTPWIAADIGLQKRKGGSKNKDDGEGIQRTQKIGKDLGGAKTTPIRSLEAGAFIMEMWIEEGKAKFESGNSSA